MMGTTTSNRPSCAIAGALPDFLRGYSGPTSHARSMPAR